MTDDLGIRASERRRARFGKFVIEPPLSEAMQAFAAKHGVVDLVVQ
jgi:hypothetical protein